MQNTVENLGVDCPREGSKEKGKHMPFANPIFGGKVSGGE